MDALRKLNAEILETNRVLRLEAEHLRKQAKVAHLQAARLRKRAHVLADDQRYLAQIFSNSRIRAR